MAIFINTDETSGAGIGVKSLVMGFDYEGGQRLLVTSTSTQSQMLTSELVLLKATTDCHVVVGMNPVATSTGQSLYLFAGEAQPVRVPFGNKVAVIRAAVDGNLYILPAR